MPPMYTITITFIIQILNFINSITPVIVAAIIKLRANTMGELILLAQISVDKNTHKHNLIINILRLLLLDR